jgi:hypothetical protein
MIGFGSSADFLFVPDKDYFVSAYFDGKRFSVSTHTETHALYENDQIVREWRDLPAPGSACVKGTVQCDVPLEGITITIEGPETRRASTDQKGEFRLDGLKPGDYTLTAILPQYLQPLEAVKIALSDQTSANVRVYATYDGRVSGTVIDQAGKPARGLYLQLKPAVGGNTVEFDKSAFSGADGSFRFESLPPGEYVLGASLSGPINSDSGVGKEIVYPPSYYAGASNAQSATRIKLGVSQHVQDIEFRLLPPISNDTVAQSVIVRWPDGRVAAGANISVVDLMWPYSGTSYGLPTDSSGRTLLRVRKNQTYELYAYANRGYDGQSCAAPVTVVAKGELRPLEFVLKYDFGNCTSSNLRRLGLLPARDKAK